MQNKIIIYGNFSETIMPVYSTEHASGADLKAKLDNPVSLQPKERAMIPTGIFLQLPEGYEAQIRPRSGIAIKHGVTVLNSPGTIDADYRGEINVILINHGTEPFTIAPGDRIAQLVFVPVIKAEFVETKDLSNSERGAGGFGSTGI